MSKSMKFEVGDRVRNTKTNQVGSVLRRRHEGVYLVSIQGVGEREWNEADMESSSEPKSKVNRTWDKQA
jgi:hypothetical protein